MEEEVEYIFENNTNFTNYTPTAIQYVQDTFRILTVTLGTIANILIIYIIVKNKRMKSRTNLMILNFAIADILFLLSTPSLIGYILIRSFNHVILFCILADTDVLFQVLAMSFIFVLLSNSLIKTKRFSTRTMLISIYSTIAVALILNVGICIAEQGIPILSFAGLILFIILLVVLLVKDIIAFCKRKTNPVDEKVTFRVNIARIYVYNWVLSVICIIVSYPNLIPLEFFIFLQVFFNSGFLSSVYILIYLVYKDKFFKICLLNLFRRGENKYDVDATICFSDENSEDGNDSNVNIDFNKINNVEVVNTSVQGTVG